MKANTILKQARVHRKIDQVQLAHAIGVSIATYARWEQGRTEPSLYHLRILCLFFQMPPEELGYIIYQQRESTHKLDTSRREQML